MVNKISKMNMTTSNFENESNIIPHTVEFTTVNDYSINKQPRGRKKNSSSNTLNYDYQRYETSPDEIEDLQFKSNKKRKQSHQSDIQMQERQQSPLSKPFSAKKKRDRSYDY
jgi:hypothetical protein